MNTVNKNTETLLETSKEVGLDIRADKTEYMVKSRHQKFF
jgi:hypothetical protein